MKYDNKLLGWGADGGGGQAYLGPCWILAWDVDGNGWKNENEGPCWIFAWGVIGLEFVLQVLEVEYYVVKNEYSLQFLT